jgi:peptidoglycan DL-endopeptidase CwlO
VGRAELDDDTSARRRKGWVVAFAAALFVLTGLLLSPPATAEPPVPAVPDEGARPPAAAAGPGAALPGAALPGTGVPGTGVPGTGLPGATSVATPVLGPLAQQIRTETTAVQALAEQLKAADAEVAQIHQDVETKRTASETADADVARLRDAAGSVATEAYKASRALGPLGGYAHDLQRLSRVAPALGPQPGGEAAARDLARAEDIAQNAGQAYRAARSSETVVVARRDGVKASYDQRVAALTDLRSRNSKELAKAEAEAEAFERSVGVGLNLGAGPDGWEPNPLVKKVLDYALSKLGLPYVFGTEGPKTYDCSGLVWDSYRQVGVQLPRIANEQYNGTTKINRTELLAGDLVFFGPPGSWVGIYHVGIYLGGGRMIQAPTTGDVVKVSSVWWSRFYGATRVLPAHKVTPPQNQPPPVVTAPSSPPPSSTPPSSTPPSSTPPSSTPPSSKPPSSAPPAGGGAPGGGTGGSSAPPAPNTSASSSAPAR